MVPTSRLGYPARSHHQSVLRCLEPAWCLFSAPGQRVQGSGLATEQLLAACGSEDLGEGSSSSADLPAPRLSQPGWDRARPQLDCYSPIPLNTDGSVWRSTRVSQQTLEKTQIYLAPTTSSLPDIFFPGLVLGGGTEASRRG